MKEERDIDMILTSLRICSDAKARQAAFERMMKRRAELLAADSELSCEELSMAAGGVANTQSEEKRGLFDTADEYPGSK